MAEHTLIDDYLDALARRMAHRRGRADELDELRDHLVTAAEGHERAGLSPADAQRQAIAELGEPHVVARSFEVNRRGRPAVPTEVTRLCGMVGMALVVTVPLALVSLRLMFAADDTDTWGPAAQGWYAVFSVGAFMSTAALTTLLFGVVRRQGGLGVAGIVGLALAGLGTVVSVAAWFAAGWLTLVGLGALVVAAAAWREAVVPRWALAAVPVGLALLGSIGATSAWAEDMSRLLALLTQALMAGAAGATMLGAFAIGRRLASEATVDDEAPAFAS